MGKSLVVLAFVSEFVHLGNCAAVCLGVVQDVVMIALSREMVLVVTALAQDCTLESTGPDYTRAYKRLAVN